MKLFTECAFFSVLALNDCFHTCIPEKTLSLVIKFNYLSLNMVCKKWRKYLF